VERQSMNPWAGRNWNISSTSVFPRFGEALRMRVPFYKKKMDAKGVKPGDQIPADIASSLYHENRYARSLPVRLLATDPTILWRFILLPAPPATGRAPIQRTT